MKRLIFTWTLLRLVLQSKGYGMKELPDRLKTRWPKRKGLGSSSIQEKASKGKKAPRDVAGFVTSEEDLPTRQGYEKPAKVVRLGLAAMSGQPSPTLGRKLDALGGKLDGADAKLDAANAKLDTAHTKLDSNGGKLDALRAEVATMHAEQRSARHVTGTVLGLLLLVGLLFAGRQPQPDTGRAEWTHATRVPPVSNVANGATGVEAYQAYLRAALSALLEMGKKSQENWIPKEPFPGQKLAKDCRAGLREQAINGGCWVHVVGDPPCGELFRHGNGCYRPVSADPEKPVGMAPAVPGQP